MGFYIRSPYQPARLLPSYYHAVWRYVYIHPFDPDAWVSAMKAHVEHAWGLGAWAE
jgi:hypothetical protein